MSESEFAREAREARRAVREAAGTAADTLAAAGETAREARARADEALHAARDLLAEASQRLAARLDAGASAVSETAPARRAGEVWSLACDGVRRHPGLSVAAAALAGFALAQMLHGRDRRP